MAWAGRSGPNPTDKSECQLTDMADLIAVYACTQFAVASQTDPQSEFKSVAVYTYCSALLDPDICTCALCHNVDKNTDKDEYVCSAVREGCQSPLFIHAVPFCC